MSGSPKTEPSETITLNRTEGEDIRRILARAEMELRHVAGGHSVNAAQLAAFAEIIGRHIAILDQELRA